MRGGPRRAGYGAASGAALQRYRDDARRCRAQFDLLRVGIHLLRQHRPVTAAQLELVPLARHDTRQEDLPDAAIPPQTHREAPAVPMIEIADHAHAGGIRRPHRKARTRHTLHHDRMRAQRLPRPPMRPLGEQPEVRLTEQRWEAVRVFEQRDPACLPSHLQQIGLSVLAGDHALEQIAGISALQFGELPSGSSLVSAGIDRRHRRDRGGTGHEHPQCRVPVGAAMRSEHRERVGVTRLTQCPSVFCGDAHRGDGTCQIRLAYSRMLRSEENAPIPATLAMALCTQASRLRYRASTKA